MVVGLMSAALASAQGSRYRHDEILVKFKPYTQITQTAFHSKYRTKAEDTIFQIGVTRIKLPAGMTVDAALAACKKLKDSVVYAEKSSISDYMFVPDDPRYSEQYSLQTVQAPQGWSLNIGSQSVIIAICDSGVRLDHEDLAAKVLIGTDTFDDDSDPTDTLGHGTFCAGIAAAATHNGKGIAGVGFNCRIMPVRVGDNSGVPNITAAEGIVWAADHGANVISLSFGSLNPSQTMKDAIDYAVNTKHVLVVASAGNNGNSTPTYPASFPNVVSVGSTDATDQRAAFSSFGSWVDVAAPGVEILSTTIDGGYGTASGTSYSAPIVAGVAGLLWSHAGPTATVAEIRSYLENSSDAVGSWLAHGRVNAGAALASVIQIIEVPYPAQSANVISGTHAGGSAASLADLDGAFYAVNAIKVSSLGMVSSFQSDFTVVDDPNDMNSLRVQHSGIGPSKATQFIYAYNWQTQKYDLIKSFPLSPSSIMREADLSRPFGKYIQSNTGLVRLQVRAVGPLKYFKQMSYGVDRLKLSAMIRTH